MAGLAVEHAYRYAGPSELAARQGAPELRLATSGGVAEHPHFFTGELAHPRVTAQLLRSLSRVVQARYHVPPAMLERILALADPVVTSGGGMLRFEAFSSCASAYARVDLAPESFSKCADVSPGTTNVDFNGDMRGALSRVRDSDALGLSVGASEVVLRRAEGNVVERKVALPVRWLKGFVEVQAYQAAMVQRIEAPAAEALRFLRALPRTRTGKHTFWVVPSGRGFRLSQREAAGAVSLSGTERLRVLEELAPYARTLRVYGDDRGASVWELDHGFARFVLALSPEVWRGFSGEGQVLSSLASKDWTTLLTRARAALKWQSAIRADEIARDWGTDAPQVARAFAALGSRGLVGYDLALGSYYHRELPFDLSRVEDLQPRLEEARKLVASSAVVILPEEKSGEVAAEVQGTDVIHRVRLSTDGARCTCPWFAKHQGQRGPCKHELAVQIVLEDQEWESARKTSSDESST